MKPQLKRFARVGLWLALIAACASVVLVILQREWNLPLQISLGLVVIGLALYALLDPGKVREILSGRAARYGSNAVILLIAFIGILVVINYFIYENDQRWDLTADKENTLAPETIEILGQMSAPVTAYAFFSPNSSTEQAEGLLDQFTYEGKGNFSYVFIDPINDPVAATEANITKDGTIVVEMGDNKQLVELVSEEEITSALVRLMNPEGNVVYFLTGHGEFGMEDSSETTYTQLKEKLESKNYSVQTLNLLTSNQIPEDADVIVIGGPLISLAESEISLLTVYQDNGGAMVVMEEPIPLTQMGDDPDLLSDYLVEKWGVLLGKDIVVDLKTNQAFMAYADQYGVHLITEKMRNMVTAFPTTRSVNITDAIESGVSQTLLIYTAAESWAETELDGLADGNIQADPESDLLGPVSIAVAAENFVNEARLVVFGDAEFATNSYFSAYGNADMIINSIDWAVGQEDLINLTPKQTITRTLIPPKTFTLGLLFLGSMIILPGIVLTAGITAWIVRRRRG